MHTIITRTALLALFIGFFQLTLSAQTLDGALGGPSESLVNEEACFSITLENNGAVGYQPYLRVFLPPQMPAATFSASFMGQDIPASQVTVVGTFSGAALNDPNLVEGDPNRAVTGTSGYSFAVVNLPVGAMVQGGIVISVELCVLLEGELFVPVELITQPVFRYGDTATGENGSMAFAPSSAQVSPIPYRTSLSRLPGDVVGGACNAIEYTLAANIATNQLVTGMNLTAQIPSGLAYVQLMMSTPGCVVTQQPTIGGTGNFTMQCNNVMGSSNPQDVKAVFLLEPTTGPEVATCDSLAVITDISFSSNQAPQVQASLPVNLYHLTFSPVADADIIAPGQVLTLGVDYEMAGTITGVDELLLELTIPDGLNYIGNAQIDGQPVNVTTTSLGGGQTLLAVDLIAEGGANGPCAKGSFTFETEIGTFYTNGSVIAARDRLFAEGTVSYTLPGQTACVRPFEVGVSIPAPEFTKEVVSAPANGLKYTAGENVVYRITMTSDGVALNDAVFEDLFPIPVHIVSDLNLAFGTDIVHAPTDNQGIIPQAITINASNNSLRIEWGDIPASVPGSPAIVSVDISIPVSGEPFAPFLRHSNFARLTSVNSSNQMATSLSYTTIDVGAPNLQIFKGVLAVDNADAVLAPYDATFFLTASAQNVDAFDWVTFRTTLRNIGDAPAYDVIVNYFPPTDQLHQCSVDGVTLFDGTPVTYSGDLYGAGLVVSTVNQGTAGRVFVQHRCRIRNTAQSRRMFVNTSLASWTSAPGGVDYFDPVSASCNVQLARPEAALNVVSVQPGHGQTGQVHIGELVTFNMAMQMPEGVTSGAAIEVDLPQGLSVEALLSFEAVSQVTLANGGYTTLLNNAVISSIGSGTENQRRRITITTGSITNANTMNSVPEVLNLVFTATVLNSALNQSNQALVTEARLRYTNPNNGLQVSELATTTLTVVEPELEVTLSFFENSILPEGQTFVTVSVGHTQASTGNAYNVRLANDLPLGIQLVPGSVVPECEDLLAALPSIQNGTLLAQWDSIPLGTTCEFVYAVQALEGLPPCVEVANCGDLDYRSTFAAFMPALNIVPQNPLGVPRTGDIADPGAEQNTYSGLSCDALEVVIPSLTTPQITGSASVCENTGTVLSVPSYSGAFVEYTWFLDGEELDNNNHQLIIPQASIQNSGTYTAQVQIGQCVTNASQPFTLSVNPRPEVTLNDQFFPCATGTDPVQLVADVTGGGGSYTYTWTGPNYFSAQPSATILNASEAQSGVYSLAVTDQFGCTSEAASAQITITTAPPLPAIVAGASVCEGQSFTLNTTAYSGAQTYHWETPSGPVVTPVPNLTVNNADVLDGGEYTVWVQLANCATNSSLPVQVVVNANPAQPVFTASATEVCAGSTLTFSTIAEAGSYAWTGPNGYTASTAAPPAIVNANVLNEGTYTLVVSNGNCVSVPFSLDIDVLPLPAAPAVSSNAPVCVGEALTVSSSNGADAYAWTLPGSAQEVTDSPEYSINNAAVSQSGSWSLSVFDGNCWSQPSTLEVQVDVIPSEQAYAGANTLGCAEGSAVVEAVNNPSLNGFWSAPNEDLTFASPNSQVSAVSGMIPGETHLAVWSLFNEGCGVYSSDEVTVYVPLDPTAEDDFYELVEGELPSFAVTLNDDPGPVDFTITVVTPPVNGSAEVVEGSLIRYTANEGFAGEDELVYRLCLSGCPDLCATATVKIRVFPFLRIPDIITPNGDGVNDAFMVEGIHRFPANELTVFNRWGREVYSTENYANDWEGTWNGQPLPDGTYFYLLTNKATGETLGQGYITLHH